MIMVTPEGQTVRYRPVPAIGLRSWDYEALMKHSSNTYQYELVNAASEYTTTFADFAEHDHVSDFCLIDLPELDHLAPTINVVEIR
jgi:hypothetical protein